MRISKEDAAYLFDQIDVDHNRFIDVIELSGFGRRMGMKQYAAPRAHLHFT